MLNLCPSPVLTIINIVVYIIWDQGAAAVPDVQGPLTFLQYNPAGNARTLLTLLVFANSMHYSYPLNCIWLYIFAKKHPWCIICSIPQMDSLEYEYLSTEIRCYLWHGTPSIQAQCRIICHCHCFYLTHFQSVVTSDRESAGHIHKCTEAICEPKWQQQSTHS